MTSPERGRNCYFQNRKVRKRKKHHPPSILHDKKSRTCYLCIMLHDNWSEHSTLQEHHVFSGPNRTNSEENGLKIYLCRDHHVYGPEAIHNNARIRHEVQRMAQREFERQRYDRRKRTYEHKNEQVAAVDNWIQNIEDGQTRYVFKAFYQQGLTWEKIAGKTGYSQNPDYPRLMIRDKYLMREQIK